MNNETLICLLLGGVAFLCFLPLMKATANTENKKSPPVELACETPKGWAYYKTNNLRVHRNGTWNFTSLKGRDISASNCFLGK